MAVRRLDSATVPSDASAVRLYTPAMLAELLDVPAAAIRRWHRQGALRAVRTVQRLAYFDFAEVAIARRLAQLHRAGCSLRMIDRRLAELKKLLPGVERPLADPDVVIEGRRLFRRRGNDLAEPGGQLLLDFDVAANEGNEFESPIISFEQFARHSEAAAQLEATGPATLAALTDRLQQQALDAEGEGDFERAAEAYRTLLMAAGPRAEIHFALADVLYRAGELEAARERYYAALELDEEYVEARANLGCLLAEMGELELAVATFEGSLHYHPDFADVHFHLANTLDQLHRDDEASVHFRRFLDLAPASPWADAARRRLEPSPASS